MKKTIVATAVATLFATTAFPAIAGDGLSLGANLGSAVSVDSDGLDVGLGTDTGVSLNAGNSSPDANANLGAGVAVSETNTSAAAHGGVNVGLDAGDDLNVASSAAANAGAQVGSNSNQLAVGAAADASAGINLNELDSSRVNIVLALSVDAEVIDQSIAIDSDARLAVALDDNAAIQGKLGAAGFVASDVIALKGNADGTLVVFVDDLA